MLRFFFFTVRHLMQVKIYFVISMHYKLILMSSMKQSQ